MSYFNQCDNCKGQKRLMGFGMIWQDCPVCNATGFKRPVGGSVNTIDAVFGCAPTPETDQVMKVSIDINPKKKGRSKKAKE